MIEGPAHYGSLPKPQERRWQRDLHQIPLIPLLHSANEAIEIMWANSVVVVLFRNNIASAAIYWILSTLQEATRRSGGTEFLFVLDFITV